MTGRVEPGQVVRVMTEVGIHLEDIFIVVCQSPLEPGDIGGAEPLLPAPFQEEEPGAELRGHESSDNGCRPVGRAVVDHKNMETFVKGKHCADDLLNVLLLVVGWYDDYAVAFVHRF